MGERVTAELAALVIAALAATRRNDATDATQVCEILPVHQGEERGAGDLDYCLRLLARIAGNFEAAVRRFERALAEHPGAEPTGRVDRIGCDLARILSQRVERDGYGCAAPQPPVRSRSGTSDRFDATAGAEQARPVTVNRIRYEGGVWTLVFDGQVCHLRDTKGLRWLDVLLRHPGRQFPVRTFEVPGIPEGDPSDTEVTERARLRVTRALRAAIARIEVAHPVLGRHLAVAIKTGRWCVYAPAPPAAFTWET